MAKTISNEIGDRKTSNLGIQVSNRFKMKNLNLTNINLSETNITESVCVTDSRQPEGAYGESMSNAPYL